MIDCENVRFSYDGERPALDDVCFHVDRGETVGLIGGNGAGKSTLMKALLGLVEAEGVIRIDGVAVGKGTLSQIRRKAGLVLQNSDNQMFMPTVYEDMIFGPLNYGVTRMAAEVRVDRVLRQLGVTELKHRHNHRISGGEKRMAAIATVLAMEPELILMDEPTSALDPFNRRLVIDVIRGLDKTRLIASHDLDMILDTCDRVILMSGGKIVRDGPAGEVLRERALLEANRLELPLRLQGLK